ncbi:MAG: hypothetical protein WCW66_05245 [Patescibacteria group bacterium]
MIKIDRLLIKDDQNNLFKIFNILSESDKHKEPYVKICFPKNKFGGALYDVDKSSEIIDNYYKQFKRLNIELIEFTYHYISGVSHFKSKNGHILQIKKLPGIKSKIPINILKIIIFDLDSLHTFNNQIIPGYFIIPNKFNLKQGRIIDIYINQKEDPNIEVGNKEGINYFDKYEFIDNEYGIRITLTDQEFKNKPANNGITFHRPLNPTANFF